MLSKRALRFVVLCVIFFVFFAHESFACRLSGQSLAWWDYAHASDVYVASFNIQTFGEKKANDKFVSPLLVKILSRYDLVAIQEIRSKDDKALDILLDKLNKASGIPDQYVAVHSKPLGRTKEKERFGIIYKQWKVKKLSSYQYSDNTDFERPPFSVLFECYKCSVKKFAVMVNHLQPREVVEEMQHMPDAYEATVKALQWQDILILGDFNAGCRYLSKKEEFKLKFHNDPTYKWLVPDTFDTTVDPDTHCAYDRFMATGAIQNSSMQSSVAVFHFDKEFGLSYEQAKKVSDHYPIEVRLKDSEK